MLIFLKNIFFSYRFIFSQISLKLKIFFLITFFLINTAALLDLLMIFSVGILFSNTNESINLISNVYFTKINFVYVIIASTILASLTRLICSRSILFLGDKIYVSISLKFYQLVFQRDIEFVDKVNVERLTSLIFNNASRIPESLFFLLNILSASLIILFILLFSIFNSYSFLLYYLFCGALLVYFSSGFIASLKTKDLGLSTSQSFEDLSKLFRSMIFSSRYIKTTSRNISFFQDALTFQLKRKRRSQSKELFYSGLPRITAEPTVYCCIAILYLLFRNKEFDVATISVAIFASLRILPQLQIISSSFPTLSACSYQIIDLFKVWKLLKNTENKKELKKFEQNIADNIIKKIIISDVFYKFPKFPNFKDDLLDNDRKSDFKIKVNSISLYKGKSYILTSESGAGKSVFLDLVAGLRKPDKGEIKFFCNKGTLTIKPKIRYLYQNEQILWSNILSYLLGRQIIDFKQVLPREKDLIEEFRVRLGIDFFPNIKQNHYQYLQKTFASQLPYSGGQKQRIIIWSALMENPDLLILDESLSALDDKSAKDILLFILKRFSDKIFIFVSHDESIIKDKLFSNKIFVKNGKVNINQ